MPIVWINPGGSWTSDFLSGPGSSFGRTARLDLYLVATQPGTARCFFDNLFIQGEPPPEPPPPPPPCGLLGTTAHCLRNRFRVSATFRTEDQPQRDATALPLTSDTGAFWFFRPGNIELIVKVLDGCPVNGRRWVFAAGLTDVEVTIRVADVATSKTFTIYNPRGQPFPPVQDTTALDGCPTTAP